MGAGTVRRKPHMCCVVTLPHVSLSAVGPMPYVPSCWCTGSCTDTSSSSLNKAGIPASECAPADAANILWVGRLPALHALLPAANWRLPLQCYVRKGLPHDGALQPLGIGACSCEARCEALGAVWQVAAAAPSSDAGAVHAQGHINAADQDSRDKTDWSIAAQRAPAAARQATGAPAATPQEHHPGAAARSRGTRAARSKWD